MDKGFNNTLAEVLVGNAKYMEQHLTGFIVAIVVVTFVILAATVIWGRITSKDRNKELL